MKAELMNRMQEILEEAVAAKELAGGSLLVRQHGEELCYLQAGMADRERERPSAGIIFTGCIP